MPQAPSRKSLRCLAILICTAALAACATKPVAPGARYVVSAPKAFFYKYGPAQTTGPDFALKQGTKVTMLQMSFGFSRVMTDDGTSGFVASAEVKPAPPEPPASSGRLSGSGLRALLFPSRPKRSNVQPVPGSPLFETSDPPLPLPENPEPPKPAPRFKF
jgi:hypothetical protein